MSPGPWTMIGPQRDAARACAVDVKVATTNSSSMTQRMIGVLVFKLFFLVLHPYSDISRGAVSMHPKNFWRGGDWKCQKSDSSWNRAQKRPSLDAPAGGGTSSVAAADFFQKPGAGESPITLCCRLRNAHDFGDFRER